MWSPADNIQTGLDAKNQKGKDGKEKEKKVGDLGWGESLTKVIRGGKMAMNLVSFCYIGGVVGFGVSLIGAVWTIRAPTQSHWVIKVKVWSAAVSFYITPFPFFEAGWWREQSEHLGSRQRKRREERLKVGRTIC